MTAKTEDAMRLEEIFKVFDRTEGSTYYRDWQVLSLGLREILISQAEKLRALEQARARSAEYTHQLQEKLAKVDDSLRVAEEALEWYAEVQCKVSPQLAQKALKKIKGET